VRHDRGQHGADVLRRRLLALSGREEIAGKAKLRPPVPVELGCWGVSEQKTGLSQHSECNRLITHYLRDFTDAFNLSRYDN
jgi:hypothetical protein